MPERSHDIATLNRLIAAIIDSVHGYAEAATAMDTTHAGAALFAHADALRAVVARLQQAVAQLGSVVQTEGTMRAGMRRTLLLFQAGVTGDYSPALFREIHACENHVATLFEDALVDLELTPPVMNLVEQCYTAIQSRQNNIGGSGDSAMRQWSTRRQDGRSENA